MKKILLLIAGLTLAISQLATINSIYAHEVNNNTYCTVSHGHHCSWANKNHWQTLLYIDFLKLKKERVSTCQESKGTDCNVAKQKEDKAFENYKELKAQEDKAREKFLP